LAVQSHERESQAENEPFQVFHFEAPSLMRFLGVSRPTRAGIQERRPLRPPALTRLICGIYANWAVFIERAIACGLASRAGRHAALERRIARDDTRIHAANLLALLVVVVALRRAARIGGAGSGLQAQDGNSQGQSEHSDSLHIRNSFVLS
jgi:hypothetical protein